jgi:hypothetical protein
MSPTHRPECGILRALANRDPRRQGCTRYFSWLFFGSYIDELMRVSGFRREVSFEATSWNGAAAQLADRICRTLLLSLKR